MSWASHVFFFCLVSLATALVSAAIRLREPGWIAREAMRFFVTITVGIFLFCLVVYILEWIFIRPLL